MIADTKLDLRLDVKHEDIRERIETFRGDVFGIGRVRMSTHEEMCMRLQGAV
jgi:hypothetical protein